MDSKKMKQDMYLQKALISKGLKIEDVMLLNEEEIEKLEISTKIKSFILDAQSRINVVTVDEKIVKTEIKSIQKEVDTENTNTTAEEYVLTDESFKDEIQKEIISAADLENKEVVVKVSSNPEVVQMVKDILMSKSLKSVASYLKHIKQEIPNDLLNEVESTTLSTMILEHIESQKQKEQDSK